MTYSTIIRTCTAALVALPLLLAGSAQAATRRTKPDSHSAAKRSVATTKASCCDTAPPTKKPALAKTPAATVVAPAAPAALPAAPQTVQVKGIVLNPDGRPCAGASVYPAGAPRQLVVTNAQGAFTLPVPAGAAVSLRVEYFGEGTSRVEVPVPGPEPLHITLGQ